MSHDERLLVPDSAEARAARVWGPGERQLACAEVWPSPDLPCPRWWRRPRVLRGLRMPGDRWEGAKNKAWATLQSPGWPFRRVAGFFDRLLERIMESGPRPLGGKRGSLANRFTAALYPRAKTTGVVCVLQLTDQRLLLAYVQRGRRSNLYGAVEAGWEVPADQVAWLRRCLTYDRFGVYDLGFVDGSWARVSFEDQLPPFLGVLPSLDATPAPPAATTPSHDIPRHQPPAPQPAEWSGYTGTEREVVERAAHTLPSDERLVASHYLDPGFRMRRPRRGRRTRVFDGMRLPGDRWRGFWNRVGLCLLAGPLIWHVLTYPFRLLLEFLSEWFPRGKGRALGGGWDSQAGRFAASLFPRARTTGVTYVVQLTDRRLRVTYVQHARWRSWRLGAVEPGFAVDRSDVAWLRPRPDISRNSYEFGFIDGSWARVALRAPRRRDFLDQFPVGPPR